jgi:hypothetical protein
MQCPFGPMHVERTKGLPSGKHRQTLANLIPDLRHRLTRLFSRCPPAGEVALGEAEYLAACCGPGSVLSS